jgi:hypothetical protein
MIISDLNYLEVVSEETNIVGGIRNAKKATKLKFKEKVDIDKNISGKSKVKGRIAFAEADSDAFGKNALTNALSYTYVSDNYSSSSATSAASAN